MSKLITAAQARRLHRQWADLQDARRVSSHYDPKPVIKLFTPDAAATWLIAALSPDGRTGWGVCDLGLGFVEVGEIDMLEISRLRGRLGLPTERDRWCKLNATVSEYQAAGSAVG